MNRVVIASANEHKVRELRAILGECGVELIGLRDLPGPFAEPEETGLTFQDNAIIKAVSYSAQTGMTCLADDSGLEVDALGGEPGIRSSRYAADEMAEGASDDERDRANNARLLRELEGVPLEQRTARFVCVMVLAAPAGSPPLSAPRVPPSGAGVPPSGAGVPPALPGTNPASSPPSWSPPIGSPLSRTWRRLPHWQKGGSTYFVTFRLAAGSLSEVERRIVADACIHWHGSRAIVRLVTIMPDHVHLLLTPLQRSQDSWYSLRELLHSVKSYSAHLINRMRGSSGPVWQPESFDRLIRDDDEFHQKWNYMLMNPVKAGLASRPWEYPFTIDPDRAEASCGDQIRGRDARATAPRATDARDTEDTRPVILAVTHGSFEGRIGLPGPGDRGGVPRGEHGFGYDPLFLVAPSYAHTSAELEPEHKNALSHRAQAAKAMAHRVEELLRLRP